jgi:hypothetical protein
MMHTRFSLPLRARPAERGPDEHRIHVCRYAAYLSAEAIGRIFGTVNPLPNIGLSGVSHPVSRPLSCAAIPRRASAISTF